MKFLSLSSLALFVSLLFFGCNSDDDGPPKLDLEGDCMTATINGEFFNGVDVTVTELVVGESIFLTGGMTDPANGEAKTLGITIARTDLEGPIPVGTYDVEDSIGAISGQYIEGPIAMPTSYELNSGTLVILTHDTTAKRIEGEFDLEGADIGGNAISITDGYFDIKY